jgi:rRNA maturation RNase YbeY
MIAAAMPRKSAASSPRPAVQPPLRLEISAAIAKEMVPFLRSKLRAAHAVLQPPLTELSVALVGDKAMSALHERFMGIAGPTDVLTFPLDEDARGRVTAGEVVVCVTEARRRAKAEGTELRHEVLLYAVHGMLHLCGYDDQAAADFRRMHKEEDRILSAIGVGAVYQPAEKGGKLREVLSATGTSGESGVAKRI